MEVPRFPRLADYLGLWCIDPLHFTQLWDMAGRLDWSSHEAPPVHSALEKVPVGKEGQSIAILKLTGLLMKSQSSFGGTSTIQARRDIRSAAADPNVQAILLAIDSPGGTAAGTDDLATEVRAARKMKPVYAHIDDLGASAAYWVASQAEKVFANSQTALVGSIGTVMTVYDQSGLAEKNGVKALVFKTGPIKGAGTPGAPVTLEQQDYFQGIVNDMQASFDQAVQKGRGLSKDELAAVRTGAAFSAKSAETLRLIDGVQPLSKTMDELSRESRKRKPMAQTLPMLRRVLPTLSTKESHDDL